MVKFLGLGFCNFNPIYENLRPIFTPLPNSPVVCKQASTGIWYNKLDGACLGSQAVVCRSTGGRRPMPGIGGWIRCPVTSASLPLAVRILLLRIISLMEGLNLF